VYWVLSRSLDLDTEERFIEDSEAALAVEETPAHG